MPVNDAGEMTAGEVNAGEMNAGEITAGEMPAGEMPAGEMPAGEMPAGEMPAGEMPAGEMTAGEMPAGEMPAGEMPAGEMPAGEMPAGEMPAGDTPPQEGDIITFEGMAPSDGVSVHTFFTEAEIGIQVRTIGRNGELCPEGADTIIELFETDGSSRRSIARNDDYMGGHFCSQILTTVQAGSYEVEVKGFGGSAVEDYVLEISFHPLLTLGAVCDPDSPNAGICPEQSSCVDNSCRLTQPTVSAVEASKTDAELFLTVTGDDPDLDAIYINITLYDELGGPLEVDDFGDTTYYESIPNDSAPLLTGEAAFSFNLKAALLNLDVAAEVGVVIEDIEGNLSEVFITELSVHPILPELSICTPEGFGGFCDESLICQADEADDSFSCQQGLLPVISAATLNSRGEELVVSVDGNDPNGDISAIGVTLYNEQGEAILGGQVEGRYIAEISQVRELDDPIGEQRYYAILSGDYVSETSAAELVLIDSTQLESMSILAVRGALSLVEEGANCDLLSLDDLCAEGVCYPDSSSEGVIDEERGVCRQGLPSRGETCNQELGCAEGLVCYGPNNSGGLSDRYQTCMLACDDNAEDNGCAVSELCLPDIDYANFGLTDIPSPGVCLVSDNCIPGDEESSCGNADTTCARAENITLCVDLTDVSIEDRGQPGDSCNGINLPCSPGLVCEIGLCQNICDDNTPCAAQESCRIFDEVVYPDPTTQYGACLSICNPISQDCAEGESCTIYQSDSSEGRLTICTEGEPGLLVDGELCDQNASPNYWGDCEASSFCASAFRDRTDECLPICTTEDSSPCTGERVCAIDILGSPDVGLCAGECNFFTGNGCEVDQDCLLGFQGADAMGETKIVGGCFDNPNSGMVQTGGLCVLDELTNTSNCAPGHICFDLDGDMDTECLALCQANSVEYGCPLANVCITETPQGEPVFGDSLPALGVCL